jgi:hypothetical protein
MGALYKCFIIVIIILLPMGINAATVENLDFVDYKIRAIYDNGKIVSAPLYSRAEKYGICDYGCTLELLKTGQKIEVKPDDEIVIENGVMKRKE